MHLREYRISKFSGGYAPGPRGGRSIGPSIDTRLFLYSTHLCQNLLKPLFGQIPDPKNTLQGWQKAQEACYKHSSANWRGMWPLVRCLGWNFETLEHLLFLCKFSCEFWKHVLSWLQDKNIQIESIILTDLIFGKFEIEEDFSLINHILLLGKYYLNTRKCNGKLPSLKGFIARLKRVLSIELYIARRRNKLISHHKKWEKLLTTLTDQ